MFELVAEDGRTVTSWISEQKNAFLTGEREVFLRQNEEPGHETIGRFRIYPEGLTMGNTILNSLLCREDTIVIIDEVGLLELNNKGWAEALNTLVSNSDNKIVLTVRDQYVVEVRNKFKLTDAIIFNVADTNVFTAGNSVSGF